jgi:glycosyltransferase involved in cell wall biosynthesis
MVSKACLVGIYQRKLEEMALYTDVELTVLVPPYWRDERGTLPLERTFTRGYQLTVTPMALNGNFHLHFYPRLGHTLRTVRPDILHMDEEPYNLATFHGMLLARRAGCRTLWFSWQNLLRRYPPPFSLIERYCVRKADAAIVGSHTASEVWRAKGYTGPLAVIPQFGVDARLFAPAPKRHDRQDFVVGFAGRLVEEKGPHVLFEAVAGLPDVSLVVLGSGPLQTQLEQQANRPDLAGRVSFLGTLPSTEMPDFYHKLDVLVLPSLSRPNWTEQFGRVLVEAMACGVPAIGSDCGEIPHVIGNGGLVFPEGDVGELRARIRQLMEDPAHRQNLARQGRERVLSHYTQTQVAAQTVDVYRQIQSRR